MFTQREPSWQGEEVVAVRIGSVVWHKNLVFTFVLSVGSFAHTNSYITTSSQPFPLLTCAGLTLSQQIRRFLALTAKQSLLESQR